MTETIDELDFSKDISKNELLSILKSEESKIHTYDLMRTSAYLHQESKYIQADYKENFIKIFIMVF